MTLGYEEEPDYDKIIHMFVCELLDRKTTPQYKNYDWVRNPQFYGQDNRTRNGNIDIENRINSEDSENQDFPSADMDEQPFVPRLSHYELYPQQFEQW